MRQYHQLSVQDLPRLAQGKDQKSNDVLLQMAHMNSYRPTSMADSQADVLSQRTMKLAPNASNNSHVN
jgi:hypothetical protein